MKKYMPIVRFFMKKLNRDNISAYAAQATLFIIVSMIPFLMVLISLIRFTPITESMLLEGLKTLFPNIVIPTVVSVLDEVYNHPMSFMSVAIVVSVWSAAKAVQSLRYGLNTVYDIQENRNWFLLRFRAMAETFIFILAIVLSMLLLVFGAKIQETLSEFFPFLANITEVILKVRFLILFFVLVIFFCGIYKALPNRKATWRSQIVGAVGCALAWYIFSFGLSVYINYFNGFTMYGSLTTIVFIIIWLYICMYIFLVCGEVNNMFEVIMLEIREARKAKKKRKEQTKLTEK